MSISTRFVVCLLGLLLSGPLSLAVSASDPPPPRLVEVQVTVRDPAGQPVEGAPVCVTSSTAQAGGATGVNGVLVVQIAVGKDETRVAVQVTPGCGEFRGSIDRFRQIFTSYAVQDRYWTEIPGAAATASVMIQLGEAVLVTGRAVDEVGQPVKATSTVRGAQAISRWQEDGRFRLTVRKLEPCELVFMARGGMVKLLQVPGSPVDVDVGDIVIPPIQGNAPVRVHLTDGDKADQRTENKGAGVAFIAADGSSVYSFAAKEGTGIAVANWGTGELPKLPAGTYYVTPGLFGNSLSFKVLDAARAGADLTEAGIPKIVAVAGQETALEVKVPEADAAIRSLAVPPVSVSDPPPPRHVEVQVTITTNGAAFPAGTYVAMSAAGHVFDAPTDRNGHATIVGDFPGDVTRIAVDIPTILHWGTPEECDVKNVAAKEADQAFSLPPMKFVALVPGQQQYQVAFTIPEGVTVRGRAVNAQGQPVPARADREGISNLRAKLEEDRGKFEVFGVPKGSGSFVFVGYNAIQTHIIWLTASQTQNPLDLGDVTVPAVTLDSTVTISVTGRDTVREDLGFQKKYITLIREDGRACYVFKIDDNGNATHRVHILSGPLKVQAGRYYIVPGSENTSGSSLKALRLIRAGQRALLDAANVPVIEAVANQTTSASINVTTVQQAIDNIP